MTPRPYFPAILAAFLMIASSLSVPASADPEAQPWVRVALATGARNVVVAATGSSRISVQLSSELLGTFDSPHTYTFEYSNGSVKWVESGQTQAGGFSMVCTTESGRLRYSGREYRRAIRVVACEGGVACVNVLPLEEYLWGVIPCEVPAGWPMEALKAQAVAARTYALRALEQYPDRPFDLYSTVLDQLYMGSGYETDRCTRACRETWGEVCTYAGAPIIAYYHACAGGWTASGSEMFGRDLPYLRAVPSRDAAVYRWVYRIAATDLQTSLRRAGYTLGSIQRVWVHRFSAEGRAAEIKIVHGDGVLLVGGSDLRRILGPSNIESTYFTVEGQEAPAIPAGAVTEQRYAPLRSVQPVERYSLLHPQVLVPLAVAAEMRGCAVITGEGTSRADGFLVIGSGGTREYADRIIWIAMPVRAGEIVEVAQCSSFTEPAFDFESPDVGIEVVEPAGGIGRPTGGMITFVGHGCGHGVGMSQHGARILAENGWDYAQILRYFYSGIELERYW